jgi:hypothetical protein
MVTSAVSEKTGDLMSVRIANPTSLRNELMRRCPFQRWLAATARLHAG